MSRLDYGDIDGLQDLTVRSRRAARTARETAADEDAPDPADMLTDLATSLEDIADAAEAVAGWIREHRKPGK